LHRVRYSLSRRPDVVVVSALQDLSWKCRRHVATCRRRHNVSLQFWPDGSVSPTQNLRCRGSLCRLVSARADILPNFRNSYVEIYYYRMGVHTQRYYPSQRSFLSCSPFCHVLHMKQKITTKLLNTTANTTPHHVRQHHPPMPPTKAMGAITQNRRGHPTATP
jgi:hypothetical protein